MKVWKCIVGSHETHGRSQDVQASVDQHDAHGGVLRDPSVRVEKYVESRHCSRKHGHHPSRCMLFLGPSLCDANSQPHSRLKCPWTPSCPWKSTIPLRVPFSFWAHPSSQRKASLVADSNTEAGCIGLRSCQLLCTPSRRDRRPCSSTPVRWDNEQAPCQRPLSDVSLQVSTMQMRGPAVSPLSKHERASNSTVNLLCHEYSKIRPLILSPNSVSINHCLYL